MKKLAFLAVFLFPLWGLGGLYAQNDSISLTWQGGSNKWFYLVMNSFYDVPFRVHWGDGLVTDTFTANMGADVRHTYADTTRNYNVTITATTDNVIGFLWCFSQQVSHLYVRCPNEFFSAACFDNNILLSELYAISKVTGHQSALGTQRLLPQRILVGNSVDYSDQNEFDGVFTKFNLIKNSSPAVLNVDYTISNGIILFNTAGLYNIIMTNDTIRAHENHPAQVIAEINVVEPNADATLSFLGTSIGTLDPVFDSTITNYIVCVNADAKELRITAIPTDPNAIVSGDIGVVQLVADTNIFTITVTAEDGITTKNYTITIIKGCKVGVATINNEQPQIIGYEVFDILGRHILSSHSLSKGEGWGEALPKGIYIIRIQTNKGIIIKKNS
jgi:hypothetical protein